MDTNYRGGMWEGGGGQDGVECVCGGNGTTVIASSINIFFKKKTKIRGELNNIETNSTIQRINKSRS